MAPHRLSLRIDAQVMLIKNMDETLVNGSIGRIVNFVDPELYADTNPFGFGGGGGGEPDWEDENDEEDAALYPLVEFVLPRGATRRVVITPEVWKSELPNGEVQVSRNQVRARQPSDLAFFQTG